MKDRKKHIELMKEVNRKVKQKYPPTDKDLERHPTMHRTDTLDCFVVMRGEVYLVSDTDEVLLRAGDTAVVQGVNHAWSNRSNEPVLIAGVMTHAQPLPKEQYPAPGL
jgi:mannose-6-phosphate isomerase-like protein (cupin superfamily)